MKNRNGLIYFLVIVVSVIVYLVICFYCSGLKNDIYKEGSEYQNNLNKQPINNIITTKNDEPINEPKIKSLSFAQKNINIKKGDTLKLIVHVNPVELSSSKLTWKSSDPSIVSVDKYGRITALKEGTVIITVTSSNGKTATIRVTVKPNEIKAKKIQLIPKKLSLKVGELKQITAKIEPDNATNRELVWESSNPNIASVDDNGIVKGISPGTTIITVRTKDGTVVSQAIVTVLEPEVESISFAQSEITIKKDDTLKLIPQVKPIGQVSPELTWTSSDPSTVSVDENGNIKGLKVGTATITVTTSNGKTAIIKVTVVTDEIKVENIILVPSELSLYVGELSQITAKIEPTNATNRELVWESSNPNIATVDDNGIVKGISPGTIVVTVKTKDGTVVSQITVTVKPVPTPTPTPTPTPSDEPIVFEYDYDEGNYIYLINQFPIKDEVGKNLQGEKHTQDFKLRFNESAVGVKYTITAEKLPESNLADKWTKLFLVNDGEDVQNCYRANNRVKSFNEYDIYNGNSKEVIIYEGVITSSEAIRGYKDFTFRMWVSEDMKLVNDNYLSENKTFKARINVYASKN